MSILPGAARLRVKQRVKHPFIPVRESPPAKESVMIRAANPYLNFPGNAEEAFEFYRSVFGGDFAVVVRFRDFDENPMAMPEHELDLIAHISLPLGDGIMLMGTDIGEKWRDGFVVGTNTHIHLEVGSADETDRIFVALSEGGAVEMPLDRTEWAEKYGMLRDRYGVQWMLSFAGSVVYPG
jgi:PhnB protein